VTDPNPRLVRCNAPLPSGGNCARKAVPGKSCGLHAAIPEDDRPLPPPRCRCQRPLVLEDDDPEMPPRCLLCGHNPGRRAVYLRRVRRRPEQLRLPLNRRATSR
jgi:hypothetical protein